VCASQSTYEIRMFSLDLKTDSESLPIREAGSEFQADGAAHRKERFAKSVRANGWMSSGVADERSVRGLNDFADKSSTAVFASTPARNSAMTVTTIRSGSAWAQTRDSV